MKSKYVYLRDPIDSVSYSNDHTNFSGGNQYPAPNPYYPSLSGVRTLKQKARSPFACVDWMPAENDQTPE